MEAIFETYKNPMIFRKLKFWRACSTKISSFACIHFQKEMSHEENYWNFSQTLYRKSCDVNNQDLIATNASRGESVD